MFRNFLMLVLALLTVSPSAFAQSTAGGIELSPYFGLRYSDEYGIVNPDDNAPLVGLRVGAFFTEAFHMELALQRVFSNADNVAPLNGEDVYFDSLRLNLAYHLMPDKKIRPYFSAGAGWERIESDNLDSQNDLSYNGGLGVRFFIGQRSGLRLEGRYVGSNVEIAGADEWQHNFEGTLGIFFLLGAKKDKEVTQTIQDSDSDGVVDTLDRCSNTPARMAVDATGCPMEVFEDQDGDGIADEDDQCPSTPRDAPIDASGCAVDTDNDGVKDYADRCPGTMENENVDSKGCPEESIARGALKDVTFELNSPKLTLNSETVLNSVANELKKFPDVQVEVQGHSDSTGDADYNMQLSQKRAESVMEYLISKGVNRDQLTAVGYGESNPIASNDTKEGRAKNRRVELVWLDDES